jgi:hypothetical protein
VFTVGRIEFVVWSMTLMERGQEVWLIALTMNAKETDHRRRGLPRPHSGASRRVLALFSDKESPKW